MVGKSGLTVGGAGDAEIDQICLQMPCGLRNIAEVRALAIEAVGDTCTIGEIGEFWYFLGSGRANAFPFDVVKDHRIAPPAAKEDPPDAWVEGLILPMLSVEVLEAVLRAQPNGRGLRTDDMAFPPIKDAKKYGDVRLPFR